MSKDANVKGEVDRYCVVIWLLYARNIDNGQGGSIINKY